MIFEEFIKRNEKLSSLFGLDGNLHVDLHNEIRITCAPFFRESCISTQLSKS